MIITLAVMMTIMSNDGDGNIWLDILYYKKMKEMKSTAYDMSLCL